MAIWAVQPSTARARRGPGTTGMSTTRHDGSRAHAVPALCAELATQHEHKSIFSCRAGPRHMMGHLGRVSVQHDEMERGKNYHAEGEEEEAAGPQSSPWPPEETTTRSPERG